MLYNSGARVEPSGTLAVTFLHLIKFIFYEKFKLHFIQKANSEKL
jgi:hypothetical protein